MTTPRISSSTCCAVASLIRAGDRRRRRCPACGRRAAERTTCRTRRPCACDVGRALDVVRGAARHVTHEELFGDAPAHQDRDLRLQEVLRVGVAIRLRQLHRDAHRAAARDDRDLVQRIRLRESARRRRGPPRDRRS